MQGSPFLFSSTQNVFLCFPCFLWFFKGREAYYPLGLRQLATTVRTLALPKPCPASAKCYVHKHP